MLSFVIYVKHRLRMQENVQKNITKFADFKLHSLCIDQFNGIILHNSEIKYAPPLPGEINILSLHFLERVVFPGFINLMK